MPLNLSGLTIETPLVGRLLGVDGYPLLVTGADVTEPCCDADEEL